MELPKKANETLPCMALLEAQAGYWRGRALVREQAAFGTQNGEYASDAQIRHHRIAQEHEQRAAEARAPLLRLVHAKGRAAP